MEKNKKDIKNNPDKQPVTYKKKKKLKFRPWVFVVCMIVFAIILAFSSLGLYNWKEDNDKIEKLEEEIKVDAPAEEIEEQGELVNPPDTKQSDYWYYINVPFYEVDFNELQKKNSDTVAFIHMESSNINYPVVQTGDNDYYLTHAFDKTKNDAGWVFLDYRDTLDPLSSNLVFYGHGRVNKTVFGSLKNALSKSWQSNKDNYVIQLSTPKENMVFQIFSIYTIEAESYYIRTDFVNTEEKEQWIKTMKERNTAPIDTEVSAQDTTITLSTCENNSGGRIVVHGKLIKRQAR